MEIKNNPDTKYIYQAKSKRFLKIVIKYNLTNLTRVHRVPLGDWHNAVYSLQLYFILGIWWLMNPQCQRRQTSDRLAAVTTCCYWSVKKYPTQELGM